jgi:uncharacterized protein (DUF1697 family)
MERRIALLRGINLGPHKRVPMAALRELLDGAGFEQVRTHLQSGNVVVDSTAKVSELETQLEQLLAEHFGFEVGVIARTAKQWQAVAARNPLAEVARDPKRYQVTFLAQPLERARVDELATLAADGERFVAEERELYAWHPAGVARSRLWNKLARLEVKATSRNWTTVTALAEMAARP